MMVPNSGFAVRFGRREKKVRQIFSPISPDTSFMLGVPRDPGNKAKDSIAHSRPVH